MQFGISSIVFACSFIFCLCGSKPLSSSGCECTSGCGKSSTALFSDFGKWEWCNVDVKCNLQAWDWCHDTTALYKQVVNLKNEEHMKRSDAETKAAALQARLAEIQRLLKEEKMSKARLSDQLAEEHQKSLRQDKQIADAQQQARHAEARRLDTEAAKARNAQQVEAAKEEALKLRLKLSETEKQRQAANSTAVKVQKLQAETLKRLESKTLESSAAAEGLKKFKLDAFKGISKLKAAAKTQLAKADLKQAVTEMKLESAQRSALGQAEKVKKARSERELAEKDKQAAESRMQKAELRTFRLSVRGAVRGGTGVVDKHGQVPDWKIR
jgi:hypothetical protein